MQTLKTEMKNLREWNRYPWPLYRWNGKPRKLVTVFMGYRDRGDSVKVRAYQDYIEGTQISVGEEYEIKWNSNDPEWS